MTESSQSGSEELCSSENIDDSMQKEVVKNKRLRQSLTTMEIG